MEQQRHALETNVNSARDSSANYGRRVELSYKIRKERCG